MTNEEFHPEKFIDGVVAVGEGRKEPCQTMLHYHRQYSGSDAVKQQVREHLDRRNPNSQYIGTVIEGIGKLNHTLQRVH